MRRSTRIATLLALFASAGCGEDAQQPGDKGDGGGGKADDASEERACKLNPARIDPDDPSGNHSGDGRELVQFVQDTSQLGKHVQYRCRATEKVERDGETIAENKAFVETACCDDQIRTFEFATGCPPAVRFETVPDPTAASGERQHCVDGTSDGEDGPDLVATACCELLCEGAKWDNGGRCRGADGKFAAQACCELTDEQACGDAEWRTSPSDGGIAQCYATSGDLAGHYAKNACCMDECFLDARDRTEQTAPARPAGAFAMGCLLPSSGECDGAVITSEGACGVFAEEGEEERRRRVSVTGEWLGTYTKAACCAELENRSELNIELADECFRQDLLGREDEAARGELQERCGLVR